MSGRLGEGLSDREYISSIFKLLERSQISIIRDFSDLRLESVLEALERRNRS